MQSSHRKIFTFTLSIFVVILTLGLSKGSFNQESQTIQILSHPLLTLAEAHDYDVSTCKPVIYNAPGGYVNGIKNRGICVNIYPADNCTGWFTRLTYGEHSGAYLPQTYRWDGEDLMNRTLQIASVGPCFDKCDARNWQDDRREAVKVTLYDDYGFQGNATNINVDSDECILIPPPSGRLLSMKISGDRNCCIELHSAPNCGEEFTQFRPDYPELRTMYFWNLGAKDTYAAHARAVSRCGQFCDKSVPEINPESGTSPGKKVVTFYSHPGYYGHSLNLDVTNGCVTFENEKTYLSVRTYGQCVILYEEENCKEKQGSYSLQSEGKPREYFIQKLLSQTVPIYPKSIQLCPEGTGLGDISFTIPILTLILLCIVAFLLLVFTAILAAFVSKRCQSSGYRRNEALSVACKSES